MTPDLFLPKSRRTFLRRAALATGGLALHNRLSLAAALNNGHPLAPKAGHHPAKAKHLVLFFMTGGMSHVDTFDHKPKLNEDAGKKYGSRKIKACQFAFQRHGQSGLWASELLPHIGASIDPRTSTASREKISTFSDIETP